MKRVLRMILLGCLLFSLTSGSCLASKGDVLLGDEQFEEYLPLLEGKRVALFSNHTGIVGDETSEEGAMDVNRHFGLDASGQKLIYGEHILDALIARGVNVTAIFSPEHGFRGTEDAGAMVDDSVDEKTGVPILSLYADISTHSPAQEDMEKFDTLVVDMQDVGLRYYTYYISMYYLMDACARNGKSVVILDRPNLNGFYVDDVAQKLGLIANLSEVMLSLYANAEVDSCYVALPEGVMLLVDDHASSKLDGEA